VLTSPLSKNRRLIGKRVCCGNVSTDTLPSNGYTRNIVIIRAIKLRRSDWIDKLGGVPKITGTCNISAGNHY
jgi:hypothetical protein